MKENVFKNQQFFWLFRNIFQGKNVQKIKKMEEKSGENLSCKTIKIEILLQNLSKFGNFRKKTIFYNEQNSSRK